MQRTQKIVVVLISLVFIFFFGSLEQSSNIHELKREEIKLRILDESGDSIAIAANFEILSEFNIVLADSTQHIAFPDICKDVHDSIVLVYRLGKIHYIDTTGKIMVVKGSPDGLYWTTPKIVINAPHVDDRDPSIKLLPNGNIMLNYFRYVHGSYPFPHYPTLYQIFSAVSYDNGKSFTNMEQVSPGTMNNSSPLNYINVDTWIGPDSTPLTVAATSSPVFLSDKSFNSKVILPAYGGKAPLRNTFGPGFVSTPSRIIFFENTINGRSWEKRIINEFIDFDHWLSEPCILDCGNGRMIMHVRSAYGMSPSNAGFTRQALSLDSGKTWSPYTTLGFVGHSPYLFKMKNGLILSAFRMLAMNMMVQKNAFVYTLDQGESWSMPIELTTYQGQETGYPSIIELADNKLLYVYYRPGGKGIDAFIIKVNLIYEPLLTKTIANVSYRKKVNIFPNPTKNVVNVMINNINKNNPSSLKIFDTRGNLRYQQNDLINGELNTFYLKELGLQAGIYIITISSANESFTEKILLQ